MLLLMPVLAQHIHRPSTQQCWHAVRAGQAPEQQGYMRASSVARPNSGRAQCIRDECRHIKSGPQHKSRAQDCKCTTCICSCKQTVATIHVHCQAAHSKRPSDGHTAAQQTTPAVASTPRLACAFSRMLCQDRGTPLCTPYTFFNPSNP
jgi:hypothetical protein